MPEVVTGWIGLVGHAPAVLGEGAEPPAATMRERLKHVPARQVPFHDEASGEMCSAIAARPGVAGDLGARRPVRCRGTSLRGKLPDGRELHERVGGLPYEVTPTPVIKAAVCVQRRIAQARTRRGADRRSDAARTAIGRKRPRSRERWPR